ncbi:hypothetical protein Hypma_014437 [Hypsizygus marmoreus]|uniref:CCHC-type domain-containing protein n=1 Tax=Hypsizygus marmoreus TaxID=39966 RepID=A0A369JA27_HYPMA|nr:hypothetical protein Hypma_014437 [Hypsizygus marmoreus]
MRDLMELVNKWKHRPILSLTKWKMYERKFITIGGWLHAKNKITQEDQAGFFWHGINRTLQEKVENRILAQTPTLSLTKAFPMENVIEVVEKMFERNRFDFNLAESDSDLPGYDTDSEESSDDGNQSDNEEDTKDKSHLRTHKRICIKKKVHYESSDSDSEEEILVKLPRKTRKASSKALRSSKKLEAEKVLEEADVEQLIQQLSEMSLDDPKYGLLYYKALKLDNIVEKCVSPPIVRSQIELNNNRSHTAYNNTPPQFPLSTHLPYQTQISQTPQPYSPSPHMHTSASSQRPPMTCYGCGKTGHTIRECLELQKHIQDGNLMKNEYGRITFRDGVLVQRNADETIIQAAERRGGLKSHYFTIKMADENEYY